MADAVLEEDAGYRDVLIFGTHTRILETGRTSAPADLTDPALGMQVELADGGWRQLRATSLDAGLSSITNVPAGRAFLTYGPDIFVETAADVVDLSFSQLGRADVQFATAPTPVTLNFTGLEPWAANEYFGVTSLNADVFRESVLASTASIPLGSTTGTGTFDWAASRHGLIDATRGDLSLITQHSARVVGTTTLYRSISRAATVNSITLQSGQTTSVAVPLTPAGPLSSLDIDWRTTDWEALATQTGLGATLSRQTLSLHSLPGITNFLRVAPGLVFLGANPGAAPIQGTVSWNNPFPAAWPVIVYQRAFFSHRVVALGLESAWVQLAIDASELGPLSGMLTPRMGPPGAVRINGEDANANLVGVGLTPTVSWSAPALGTATRYQLMLIEATASAGQLDLRPVAQLLTRATSVRLPPGFLVPGSTCVLWVGAETWGTNDLERKPFEVGLPARVVGVMTQPFTP